MVGLVRPIRLFLDSGVIIEGCSTPWGASKAVLILAVLHPRVVIVLAEAVEQEVQEAIALKTRGLTPAEVGDFRASFDGWFARVRCERYGFPSQDEIQAQTPTILPVVRHLNDMAAVVTAMHARPDWVLSTNTRHWGPALAARTGLRVVTPRAFLQQLTLY